MEICPNCNIELSPRYDKKNKQYAYICNKCTYHLFVPEEMKKDRGVEQPGSLLGS